jgi:hypothetical protein
LGTCAVYLDAGYIEKVLMAEHPASRIDYGKLALEMAGQNELLRAHYYNCLPYQSNPPTVEEMLGVDMALLAGKGKVTSIALFTGDSDTIPAVEAVKQEGVIVTLWHGSLKGPCSPSRELYKLCDERMELTAEIAARMHQPIIGARRQS